MAIPKASFSRLDFDSCDESSYSAAAGGAARLSSSAPETTGPRKRYRTTLGACDNNGVASSSAPSPASRRPRRRGKPHAESVSKDSSASPLGDDLAATLAKVLSDPKLTKALRSDLSRHGEWGPAGSLTEGSWQRAMSTLCNVIQADGPQARRFLGVLEGVDQQTVQAYTDRLQGEQACCVSPSMGKASGGSIGAVSSGDGA